MPKSFLISRKRAGEQFEDNGLGEPPSKTIGLVPSAIKSGGSIAQERSLLPFSDLPTPAVNLPDGAREQGNDKSESSKCLNQNETTSEFKKCHLESVYCSDDHNIIISFPRSSDEKVKFSKRRVKRSLSFSGNSYNRDERDSNYVSFDINNNNDNVDNSDNHSRTENVSTVDTGLLHRIIFPHISDNCNPTNRLSPDKYDTDINTIPGYPYKSSKATCQPTCRPVTVYLRRKSDSEHKLNALLSQERNGNGCAKKKIQNMTSPTIQDHDAFQLMMQKRNSSPATFNGVATPSRVTVPRACASSAPNLQMSDNSNLTNPHESKDLTPDTVMQGISEKKRETAIGLVTTTVTSQSGHFENAARFLLDEKVPSSKSPVTDEHQCHQDESDTKVMTLVKTGPLPSPSSPQSLSSSSSSPTSVRSSSFLKPEPWTNHADLMPLAAMTSLSSSSSPPFPTVLKSSHSSHILPKCPFPSPDGKVFFWDSPRPESSTGSINQIHSQDPSDSKDNCSTAILSGKPPHGNESSNISKSENYSTFRNITKNSNSRNESSPPLSLASTHHDNSLQCHENSKKRRQKENKILGKSFTIENIMKSENSKIAKEEIRERRVEITSSFTASSLAQDKSYLCDKSQNALYLTGNGGGLQGTAKNEIHKQFGGTNSEVSEIDSSADGISGTSRDQHFIHDILKLECSSQWNETDIKNDIDLIQRRDSIFGNTIISNPSSVLDSLGDAQDNVMINSSPQLQTTSSTTVHKLHRPLPLIPRPTPVFPSVLSYSPFTTDLYQSLHLHQSPLRTDVQSRTGISKLTINSNVSFMGKTLPLTSDPVFHKGIVDSHTLSQNSPIPLLSQNEKRALINTRNNMNTNCFQDRNDTHPYSKPVYLPPEVLKYTQNERSNLGINQMHTSPYLATKGFEEDARQPSSDLASNHEFYTMASYMNSAVPINKLPGDRSAMSHSQGRSCADNVEVQDDLQNSSCDAMSPLKALGITGSKSFKDFLESANVKLEFINKGHGIKNPLLNADFGESKLDLLSHASQVHCPVCHVSFQSSRELQRHLKGHKEIKRFLCTFCGKGFNDTFDLKRHTRTHTGVRPYKCPQCDKAFTQRCSLESHCRKIHGICPQLAFNQRRTKLYVCEDCGHATSTADEHFAHLRHTHAHSGEDKTMS